MHIVRSRTFEKQYRKLSVGVQVKFDQRFTLWLMNPIDPRLRVHPLKGSYQGYWTFNVTGDVRAVYRYQGDDLVIFALIGTHSELYG